MEIKINTEYIRLGQFLKLAGLTSTGGQAKDFIQENQIEVNGVLANQRGKKLFSGDIVKVNNLNFVVKS